MNTSHSNPFDYQLWLLDIGPALAILFAVWLEALPERAITPIQAKEMHTIYINIAY